MMAVTSAFSSRAEMLFFKSVLSVHSGKVRSRGIEFPLGKVN